MSLTPNAGMRPLGTSDLRVSPIAYGYWRFAGTDVQTATKKVQTAIEAGINLMDHADIYGLDDGTGMQERSLGRSSSKHRTSEIKCLQPRVESTAAVRLK